MPIVCERKVLYDAITDNDIPLVAQTIASCRVPLNFANHMPPLIYAVQHSCTAVVELLLKKNIVSVDYVTPVNNISALYSACDVGNMAIARLLIEAGHAAINIGTSSGATPLHAATLCGADDIVKILLQRGANVNQQRFQTGSTALYIACQQGFYNIVKLLLDFGADPDVARKTGATPLYIATELGHTPVVKILIEHHANPNKQRISDGATPLFSASWVGRLEIVNILLSGGADASQHNFNGTTPLGAAAFRGLRSVAESLITYGHAQIDLQREDDGYTSLMMATRAGRIDVVNYFLHSHADVNLQTWDGRTALVIALSNHTEV